ncbi:hypothetical protein ERO13_D09G052942v2 [Gossypium hirsutum]|nr:hypothetical protein ERO13_D09G052942v2 [Gossypium hirsutum]
MCFKKVIRLFKSIEKLKSTTLCPPFFLIRRFNKFKASSSSDLDRADKALSPSPRRFFDPLFNSDDDGEKGDAVTSLEKARVDLARRRSTRGDLTLLRREGRKLLLLRRESILETLGVSGIQVI